MRIVGHVFPTSYAAVERDLPALIARHKPDALLMFGLATRAKRVRIETRARNALALLPDVKGATVHRAKIAPGGPAALTMPAPALRLLNAARTRARAGDAVARRRALSLQLPVLARGGSGRREGRPAARRLHPCAARAPRPAPAPAR